MPSDADIHDLKEAIKESKASSDWEALHKEFDALAELYTIRGSECGGSGDFLSADQWFSKAARVIGDARRYYRRLRDTLGTDAKTTHMKIEHILEELDFGGAVAKALAEFYRAQSSKFQGSMGETARHFKRAEKLFLHSSKKTDDSNLRLLSASSGAGADIAEGTEYLRTNNYDASRSSFQRAKLTLEKAIEHVKDGQMITTLNGQIVACEAYYYLANSEDAFHKRDFERATEQSKKGVELYHQFLKTTKALPQELRNVILAEYHILRAHNYLFEGEWLREQEKWDASLVCFRKVMDEWVKSAEVALRSVPVLMQAQERLIHIGSVQSESYIENCKKERKLLERIRELENEKLAFEARLIEAVKGYGITISNSQELSNTVVQNAQMSQKIENGLRQTFEELVDSIRDSPLEDDTKDRILCDAEEVRNSRGQDSREKMKEFVRHVSETTRDLGEAAKQIVPFVTLLSFLLKMFE